MQFEAHIPSYRLSPFIRKYLIIESEQELVNRILPDTSLVMAFRFKGQVSHLTGDSKNELATSIISGLRKSGRLINYSNNTGNILVIFKEAGAQAFVKEPLHEFFEKSIALNDIDGYRNISILEEKMEAAESNKQRIDCIEQFLLAKLYSHKQDQLIAAAVEKIYQQKGLTRIKDLVQSLYISQDAFEKRFRKTTGTSPKQFSSIVRMKSIIHQQRHNQTLTGLAFDGGYFDQPHFNKEFKIFTGQTPGDFFKTPPRW